MINNVVHLCIPSVPPSVNHLYTRTRRGGRALSVEGRRYKTETKTWLTRNYPTELQFLKKNEPYLLAIHMTFADKSLLYNSSYPTKTESRYKKLDVTNRIKVLEDALTEATAVDDSHHWTVTARKSAGKTNATHLWLWNLNDGPNPITNTLDTLLALAEDE